MLPPDQRSVPDLAREEGISESTLYALRTRARNEGRLLPDSDNTPDGWSYRGKFNNVLETACLSETELTEYCRSKGIHTVQIAPQREACMQANNWDRASSAQLKSVTKAAEKRTKKLERELLHKIQCTRGGSGIADFAGKARCRFRGGRGRMISLGLLEA